MQLCKFRLLVTDSEKQFLRKLLEKSKDSRTCSVCERGFKNDKEYEAFTGQVRYSILFQTFV